jgi:hypothetical protein
MEGAEMAIDASEVLGSPQIAGVVVNRRGTARRRAGTSGGVGVGSGPTGIVGGAIGSKIAGKLMPAASEGGGETPAKGGFLALTKDEFAVVELKSGLVKLKPVGVVVRMPRSQVTSAELGSSVSVMPLTISLADGTRWDWEVPRPSRKQAEKLVEVLNSSE